MARAANQQKAQAAWNRLMAFGGHGVWDGDVVIVSLADTSVTDADMAVFRDLPFVQVLDLSRTGVSEVGLAHLAGVTALTELIVVGAKLGGHALAAFRQAHPVVKVVTKPPPKGAVNPFTGEPL